MIKNIALLTFLFAFFTVYGDLPSLFDTSPPLIKEKPLTIHNRPLAKVNGKTISLMDVVKKMDLFLYERHPAVMESTPSIYQFYAHNWQHILDTIVHNELMIADAKEKEVEISEGDIREELESRFGPNTMKSLDKLHLQYEEAKEMIYAELLVQQMLWRHVQSVVIHTVLPQDIKEAYKLYLQTNPPSKEWHYQLLTFPATEEAESLVQRAAQLVHAKPRSLQEIKESLAESSQCSLSKEFTLSEKNISKSHLEILSSLSEGEFSEPVLQKTKNDHQPVYRVFHLISSNTIYPTSFEDIVPKLTNELISNAFDKENAAYMDRLKQRFECTYYELPMNYIPFSWQ